MIAHNFVLFNLHSLHSDLLLGEQIAQARHPKIFMAIQVIMEDSKHVKVELFW
jgi:hypothetical protein